MTHFISVCAFIIKKARRIRLIIRITQRGGEKEIHLVENLMEICHVGYHKADVIVKSVSLFEE
jgi:hypothetical protein